MYLEMDTMSLSKYNTGSLFTVGKQSPWQLSFVYMSQVNLTVRTEPKLRKYLGPFR